MKKRIVELAHGDDEERKLAKYIYVLQKSGKIPKYVDREGYVCYDEKEYADYKAHAKVGRKANRQILNPITPRTASDRIQYMLLRFRDRFQAEEEQGKVYKPMEVYDLLHKTFYCESPEVPKDHHRRYIEAYAKRVAKNPDDEIKPYKRKRGEHKEI